VAVQPGIRPGPYEILSAIGAGGHGESLGHLADHQDVRERSTKGGTERHGEICERFG
jgi:hypothetical protein